MMLLLRVERPRMKRTLWQDTVLRIERPRHSWEEAGSTIREDRSRNSDVDLIRLGIRTRHVELVFEEWPVKSCNRSDGGHRLRRSRRRPAWRCPCRWASSSEDDGDEANIDRKIGMEHLWRGDRRVGVELHLKLQLCT
jgi:hypothetical protein